MDLTQWNLKKEKKEYFVCQNTMYKNAGQIVFGVHVKFWELHMNKKQNALKSEIMIVDLKSGHTRIAFSPFRGICTLLGMHGLMGSTRSKTATLKYIVFHNLHNKDYLRAAINGVNHIVTILIIHCSNTTSKPQTLCYKQTNEHSLFQCTYCWQSSSSYQTCHRPV